MMKFVRVLSVAVVAVVALAGMSEAKGFAARVGSFGRVGTIRPSTPYRAPVVRAPSRFHEAAPEMAPAAPKAPVYRAPLAAEPVVAPVVRPSSFLSREQTLGYTPTVQQRSLFNSPWFWMYMMSGHSHAAASPTGVNSPAMNQAQFETNCKTAATQADKPAGLDVKVEDCPELARLAYAKTQVDAAPASALPPLTQHIRMPQERSTDWGAYLFWGFLGLVGIGGMTALIRSVR